MEFVFNCELILKTNNDANGINVLPPVHYLYFSFSVSGLWVKECIVPGRQFIHQFFPQSVIKKGSTLGARGFLREEPRSAISEAEAMKREKIDKR